MRRLLLLIPVVLTLASCNTMSNKTYQKISIHTPGVENVECILETSVNKYLVLTPGVVDVDRASDPLTVTCQKAQYLKTVEVLESKLRMVPSQLDVFNGIIPGLSYDIASNSIYAYPETVVINMVPDPNRVVLPPREVHVLPLKKVAVTPRDVAKAKADDDDEALMDDLLNDVEADKAFSRTSRK
ncbi:MAG: hypothetical protein HY052_01545 [Proteobacteria bacterium]|nr:hypothetical protein [Pseudomonadota bacterium]